MRGGQIPYFFGRADAKNTVSAPIYKGYVYPPAKTPEGFPERDDPGSLDR